jgi:hypothetical protein
MNISVKKIIAPLALSMLMVANAWAGGDAKMLKCELEAPKTVKLGETVSLTFKLTNISKQPLMVLIWNTPLEGWFGNSFKVTRDSKWVNYMGAMVKRFRPSEDDYAQLAVGASIENKVNLAEGYDMKTAGIYKFVYNGRLQDVQAVSKSEDLSSQRQLRSLQCNDLIITIKP